MFSMLAAMYLLAGRKWKRRYLEVFAADQACIDIDGAQRHRAALFKIKVQILQRHT